MRLQVSIAVVALLVGAGVVCGGTGAVADSTSQAQSAQYSYVRTARCLRSDGATIRRLRPLDARLRAMRDLAQRTSYEVRVRNDVLGVDVLGVAFQRTESDAKLLVELLVIPADPYRVVRNGNVVVMGKKQDRAGQTVVLGCLRG